MIKWFFYRILADYCAIRANKAETNAKTLVWMDRATRYANKCQ